MSKNEFIRICNFHCVDVGVALESETVRAALAMAREIGGEDGRAMVEDAIAGEF